MAEETRDDLGASGETVVPEGNTEPPEGTKTPEPVVEEVNIEELQKKVDALLEQEKENKKTITELSTAKATMETRLSEVGKPDVPAAAAPEVATGQFKAKAKTIFDKAYENPEEAAAELDNLLNDFGQNISASLANKMASGIDELVEIKLTSRQIKKDKPHLAKLEPQIEARVMQLLNSGMTGKAAFDKAIAEIEGAFTLYDSTKKEKEPAQSTVPPRGSQGATGASPAAPAKAPETVPTGVDWIKERKDALAKRFI